MSVLTYGWKINQQGIAICIYIICLEYVNSLTLSDAYMRQKNIPLLVRIMACRLFVDNPLVYCQFDPNEHISMKFYLTFKCLHSIKCIWKCRLRKWRLSCFGLNVLTNSDYVNGLCTHIISDTCMFWNACIGLCGWILLVLECGY